MASDSSPTTLKSLQQYASDQTELVDSLLNTYPQNTRFRDTDKQEWVQFWSSTWGRDPDSLDKKEEVLRGPDRIEESLILPGVVPTHCDVMLKPKALESCWDFDCEKIFIRPEYKEAEEFVLSACGAVRPYRAFVVTGQPGIAPLPYLTATGGLGDTLSGKSVFLLRIFLRRLALMLPTALQIDPDCALLFYQGGVKEFVQLSNGYVYAPLKPQDSPLGRIWALVDSNRGLHEPPAVFKEGPFFVVKASSPLPVRLEWTRGVRTKFLYMKLWSFSEVLQARYLIESVPPSEKKLWYLHTTYGASLRNLFVFAGQPDRYRAIVISESHGLSSEGFARLLLSPYHASDNSYYLMSTGPSPTDRTMPEWKFASLYVFERCFERVVGCRFEGRRAFSSTLHNRWCESAASRMALEYFHTGSVCGNVSSPAKPKLNANHPPQNTNSRSTDGCSSSQTPNSPPPPSRFTLHSTWQSVTQTGAAWRTRTWSKIPGMPRGTWLFSHGGETKENCAEELSKK